MTTKFNLAKDVPPGEDRLWLIRHRPNAAKPVRIELREWTISDRKPTTPVSLTRLIGFIDTIADAKQLVESAKILDQRVGNIDKYVGIYEGTN